MNSIGSVWQKWDLHIHTPASFKWEGQKFEGLSEAQHDAACKAVLDRMNETNVVAYCIMDYWHFDGYIALREYISKNPNATEKRIFPGMEFRLVAPTAYRLNTHVLVSDEVPIEKLRVFVSYLQLAGNNQPLTRQGFIDAAKVYDEGKLKEHGFSLADRNDDDKMHLLGQMTVLITQESLRNAINVVGRDNCLLIQPYGTKNGIAKLKWKEHPYADTYLMKWADCFETRDQGDVELFLNTGDLANQPIGRAFLDNIGGYPKPVFSGSDAHSLGKYGVYPSQRATWLKAQPTFKGLKQVCHEPAQRCHVGDRPQKLVHIEQNPTKYMRSLRLEKINEPTTADHWFAGCEIELNPGLIAIIGNKGSGKSALADIIALAGNSHCEAMEFLNDRRFRKGNNPAKSFNAILTWEDNSSYPVNLGDGAKTLEPQRVRYLPQHFIEDLCNEIASGNETNFGRELRKVIFSHVPVSEQLGRGTLDELLDYLIESRREAFSQTYQSLRTLNETIVRYEVESSASTIQTYQKSLELKEAELKALESTPLDVVEAPADDPQDETTAKAIQQIDEHKTELEKLQKSLGDATTERQALIAEAATLNRLLGHVDNFESYLKQFDEDHAEEFNNAGFTLSDIIKVTVNKTLLSNRLTQVTSDTLEYVQLIGGTPASDTEPEKKGLNAFIAERTAAINKLQEGLNAPQKAYQEYLKEVKQRNNRRAAIVGAYDQTETIEYYKDRLKRAKEKIPAELELFRAERRDLVRKLHAELLKMRDTYTRLYAPVQKIAAEAATSAHSINLEFDASVETNGFENNFLDYIHRGRVGTFQGDDESRTAVSKLLRAHDFNSTDSVVQFTDAIIEKLTNVDRNGSVERVTIASQLREKKKLSDLYDYIFGLEYLEIRYNLRLGGKDISQLSPGEKGALLLVFYLLLDTEEIPIIIDQPEHNLDNESVVRLLVDCIRKARDRRQVVIVTHNPNLAVFCDADQLICCSINKIDGNKIEYSTGAIEDYDINSFAVNVLEGSYPAFTNRGKKWHKPECTLLALAASELPPQEPTQEELAT